ncbi:MAG: hypothetical protein IKI69_04175 [Oscillospiraceae bacterium]|nr:hypothetical protein [Oscillospiraceae bacterium]
MGEGYWVVRTYESGIIGEKTKFWIPGAHQKSKRREKTEIRKQLVNEQSAVKALARLLNANFGEGDLLLGLDYSSEGIAKLKAIARAADAHFDELTEGEQRDRLFFVAKRQMELCLRRVDRKGKASGHELRYIGATSDMDGDTQEAVQVHHHMIVPADTAEIFLKKWKLGGVSWSPISKQADLTPIAEYLLKQVRRFENRNKYCTSRNLVRPRPKDRAVRSDAELRVPAGGLLLYRQEYKTNTNEEGERWIRPQYIRYIIPERKRKGAGADEENRK